MPSDLFRLEKGLVGERLVPVRSEAEATHVAVTYLQRVTAAHERTVAELRQQMEHVQQRLQTCEMHLTASARHVQQAETTAAHQQEDARRRDDVIQRLRAKNADLIGEKRRLRDALIAKTGLPHIHFRVDVDRDGTARTQEVCTLDAFPHRERVHEALAEARRIAERHGGHLRHLRLDTVAWRAVIHRILDED